MRRRDLLGLASAGIAAWPIRALGQQTIPLIGFISSRSPDDSKPHLAGFRRGLEELGFIEGKTVAIEYRWAMGQYDQLPRLAKELVELDPKAIAAPGGIPSARAARAATNSIPIFFVATDPVREGLVASLSHPGGNITGVDFMSGELTGKRLELIAQLVPGGKPIAFLADPKSPLSGVKIEQIERAARSIGRELIVRTASSDHELDQDFVMFSEGKIAGLVVENDPYFDSRRQQIIELAKQRSIPAIYHIRDFPAAGGLMSYGASLADGYHQMGVQIGRLLKGASITELPVVRPTRFELIINLRTAKELGLAVPASLFAIADETIE
jgi:putative tryptophan/tyrosine transport system substrate-binding protein